MSAPQIPNLLDSLRASRSSRGRGGPTSRDRPTPFQRPPFQSPSDSATPKPTGDAIVQRTDEDAAGSRLSAVQAGYLQDDFAWAFMPGNEAPSSSSSQGKSGGGVKMRIQAPRRMPVINRGTYVRCVGLDRLVESWVDSATSHGQGGPVQVVSLGAGTDTRFFRFVQRRPELARRLRWHEIDFGETVGRKIAVCERDESVNRVLREAVRVAHEGDEGPGVEERLKISEDGTSLLSRCYSVHSVDLRLLAEEDDNVEEATFKNAEQQDDSKKESEHGEDHHEAEEADTRLPSLNTTTPNDKHNTKSKILRYLPGLDPHLPTLLLSECCLTYFEPSISFKLLQRFSHALAQPHPPPNLPQQQPYTPPHPQTSNTAPSDADPSTAPQTRPSLAILLYEPLHPSDAFGRTMTSNLAGRGITMPSVYAYPTLAAQHERLRGCFFANDAPAGGAVDVAKGDVDVRLGGCEIVGWWDERVDEGEKERLRRAEGLDEEEEWRLLAGHYGFVWGSRGSRGFLE